MKYLSYLFQRKIELRAEDTESRSSENSDGGVRRRRPAPLPPNQQNRQRFGSIPDVAAVSQSDLSVSRLSRVSTGSSGGSSQDIRQESAFTQVASPPYSIQPNNTSTPAKPHNLPYRVKPFEDLNNSAFSRVQSHDANESYNSPHYKGSRENGNRLTPDARLDMLTRGNNSAFSPASQSGARPPLSNHSSPNDSRSRSHDGDMSIQSGPSQPSPQQNWNRGQQGQSSGPRPVKATHPQYPRSHSPGRVSHQQYSEQSPATQQQSPPRKSNILVSRADIGPRSYGQQRPNNAVVRARPASAFGAPVSNNPSQNEQHLNSSFQSPLNNTRPSRLDLNNSQNQPDVRSSYDGSFPGSSSGYHYTNGPTNNMPPQRRQQPHSARSERPKSVPPTMFNAQLAGVDSNSSQTENYIQSNHTGIEGIPNHIGSSKGTPPVPPPRKTKDVMSRYSVLREPTSPTRPGAGRGPVGNVPGPGTREQSEPGKKEIWYEYGCV